MVAMPSTSLHTATQSEVQRAQKHSGLRRWAATWGRAAVIAVAFTVQMLVLVAVLTFLAEWSSTILAVQSVLAVVVMGMVIQLVLHIEPAAVAGPAARTQSSSFGRSMCSF